MNDIIQNDYPEATPPTRPKPAHNRKHRRSYQQSLQAQVDYRFLCAILSDFYFMISFIDSLKFVFMNNFDNI